ncbi:MAG: amino acid ABC transporter ATP-binding protein [Rubrivivax sp.]|nr:MAG: amino acid ABC transporter ATP-binding protein [Rubrivivax sp.]
MAAVFEDDPYMVAAAEPLVSVTALYKRYGNQEALCGVDLTLNCGEIVAVIGGRGAGKSTLLRCVAGRERFQSGTVSVQGRPPPEPSAPRQPVNLIFQGLNLLPHLSVGLNLMLAPALAQRPGAAGQARELLARLGMAESFDRLPGQLSPAQRQRVVIARALAPEPVVLLCDDLTSPADREQAGEVGMALRALAGDGLAVLLATDDPGLAGNADRVVFLHEGRVHESGTPKALFGRPRTSALRRFLAERS